MQIEFRDEKAVYHNYTGPGGNKNKIRRMLPDQKGEDFNSKITNLLSNILKKSTLTIIQRNNQ